jgi:ribosomal protein S5
MPAPLTRELSIRVYIDGDAWCAVFGDFIDLQASPAGFGLTAADAVRQLLALAGMEWRTPCPRP